MHVTPGREPETRGSGGDLLTGSGAGPSARLVKVDAVAGRWPRRRLAAASALTVTLSLAVQILVGWEPLAAPMWTLLTLAVLALGSLAIATFVPLAGQGGRLDLACTPCAAGAGLLAVAGMGLAASSAYDGGSASLGLALAGAGLVRRITEPPTCDSSQGGL